MRPRHNRQWWCDAVARWQQSSLTAGQFALANDICPDNFRWWRREIAREQAPAPVDHQWSLVRVEVTELAAVDSVAAPPTASSTPATLFAQVGPAELRIAVGTDVAYVGALIAAIGLAVRPC